MTIVLLSLYVIGCIGLYYGQEKILFHPQKTPDHTEYHLGSERWFEMSDGTRLHTLHHQEQPNKGLIIYLHGNRGNNRRCQWQANTFTGLGYDVLLVDYRGYGKSKGNITSEKQLYGDILQIYDAISDDYDEIIAAGYSIGTGIASHLASTRDISKLILVAPYSSIIDMKNSYAPFIPDFLVKYRLDNEKHIRIASCPTYIYHGTLDEVIPYEHGEALVASDPDDSQLTALDGEGHGRSILSRALRASLTKKLSLP